MSQQKGNRPASANWTVSSTADSRNTSITRNTDTSLEVPILRATKHPDGVRTVQIRCPHCGKTHTHGWPLSDGNNDPGHRSAHCTAGLGRGGYYITAKRRGGTK